MEIDLDKGEEITIGLSEPNILNILTTSEKHYKLCFSETCVTIQINGGEIHNINTDEDFTNLDFLMAKVSSRSEITTGTDVVDEVLKDGIPTDIIGKIISDGNVLYNKTGRFYTKEALDWNAKYKDTNPFLDHIENEKLIGQDKEIVLVSERDQKIFFDAILNPREPNEELKKATEDYKKIIDNNCKKIREIMKFMDENGIKVEPHVVDSDIISYDLVANNEPVLDSEENIDLISNDEPVLDSEENIDLISNDEFLTSEESTNNKKNISDEEVAINKIYSETNKDFIKNALNAMKNNKQPAKIKINKSKDFDDWYRIYTGQTFEVDNFMEEQGYWVKRKNYSSTYYVNINDAEVVEWK